MFRHSMSGERRYGLILPSNKAHKLTTLGQVSLVFAADEADTKPDTMHDRKFGSYSKKNHIKRQVELEMEKALTEDPTVYEYDSIYEEIHSKKVEVKKKLAKGNDNKPKYIGNLLKAAEDRKKDMERKLERKIHKEREAEKGKFDDRDTFITDSYRQKIEQMRKDEEMERIKEECEAKMDATKQCDLTEFYRQLLKQAADESPKQTDVLSTNVGVDVNRPLDKVESVNIPQIREGKSLQHSQLCSEAYKMNLDHSPVVEARHDLKERCSVFGEQMEKVTFCDSRKYSKKKRNRVADEQFEWQCTKDSGIAAKRNFPASDYVHQKCNSNSETRKGGSQHCLDNPYEVKEPQQHPNTVRRTTASSLDYARARFLARKTRLKVPINAEDSD